MIAHRSGLPASDPLLIYGATGFTGRLIVQEALARGLIPILAGRSEPELHALASGERLEFRVASLASSADLAAALSGVTAVLNAAGPFRTAAPLLVKACLDNGVHYLDIAGELAWVELLSQLDTEARHRRVMLLPGAGFDMVATDCAAALAARRVPDATHLALALAGLDAISRGSAETVLEQYPQLAVVRRAGRLVPTQPGELTRSFDFGSGPRATQAISWSDVASAYYTTGIPNITVYYEATPLVRLGLGLGRDAGWMFATPAWQTWRQAALRLLPDGPSSRRRAAGRATVVAEVSDGSHQRATIRLHTPEVYSFTATASVSIAERVLTGGCEPGFQTAANALGAEYVLSLPGVSQDR
ncbi:MAG: saccharopine dehydrogenase NADP-binding domain-containing protein [Proteobacteria bacterium]|nr:saccharopine dehydrogenase NADP-binding domain-containing protein [Pseudomonadota bacterium]